MAETGCQTTNLQIGSPTRLPLHHRAPTQIPVYYYQIPRQWSYLREFSAL